MPVRQQIAIIATTLLLSFSSYAATEVVVENAWVRTAPPSARVLAAYMDITNHSGQPRYLISASSPQFKSVELHQTSMNDGMMHMTPVDAVTLEKGKTIHIEPGGYHFMLMGPKQRIHRGDKITLKLGFKNGEAVAVEAEVKDSRDESGQTAPHQHHH